MRGKIWKSVPIKTADEYGFACSSVGAKGATELHGYEEEQEE